MTDAEAEAPILRPPGERADSLEERMPKLKFQNFGYLMERDDLLEKTLMLGKIEGKRKRGGRG